MKSPSGKSFNPERYGLIFCPQCNGQGKVSEDTDAVSVCSACGGFGLIKLPREKPIDKKGNP